MNFAEIKTALIDKAFIEELISDQTFRQQFEEGTVNTQNIFTKMKDSNQSSIKKEFLNKEETKKLINDLTINADGIKQIAQEETTRIFDEKKDELKGAKRYIHIAYQGTDDSAYKWSKIKGDEADAMKLYIAYADSADGIEGFMHTYSESKKYMGMLTSN